MGRGEGAGWCWSVVGGAGCFWEKECGGGVCEWEGVGKSSGTVERERVDQSSGRPLRHTHITSTLGTASRISLVTRGTHKEQWEEARLKSQHLFLTNTLRVNPWCTQHWRRPSHHQKHRTKQFLPKSQHLFFQYLRGPLLHSTFAHRIKRCKSGT